MKNFLIIFCLLLITNLFSTPLDILSTAHVDSALTALKMEKQDLTIVINKSKPDIYRLKVIDRLFEKPMNSFFVCDSLADYSFNNQADIASILARYAGMLDIPAQKSLVTANPLKIKKSLFSNPLDDLSPANAKIVDLLCRKLPSIQKNIDLAFSPFTVEETKYLKTYARKMFFDGGSSGDEDDLKKARENTMRADKERKKFFKMAAKMDKTSLVQAGIETAALIKEIETLADPAKSKQDYRIITTELGNIVINPQTDADLNNAVCVLDFKGDNLFNLKETSSLFILLDFTGNDIYQGQDFVQGCGFWGINFLCDYKGDDIYKANNFSQGCGIFGIGVLNDSEGDDHYFANTMVQGAGDLGIGLLIDKNGNDNYECILYGQGFGYTGGMGALIDSKGNDDYIVKKNIVDVLRYDDHFESLSQGFGLGERPYFSGGIGLLADQEGNDNYVSDIYGQGVGYWYALGGLIDKSGNDHYVSYQYAQGAGVHLAFGVLADYAGNDSYIAKGVSQGCGHDLAFGGLFDYKGDDNYVCSDLSQGGGNANALSFLCDVNGNDAYSYRGANVQGYSDWRRDYGDIGIFLDLNGNDGYTTTTLKNNKQWLQSTYGVGIDTNNSYLNVIAPTKPYDAVPSNMKLAADVEMLFLQASVASQKHMHIVKPARDRLIAMGDTAMVYLMSQLDTDLVREEQTIFEVIPKIGSKAIPYLQKALNDTTQVQNIPMLIMLLGEVKDQQVYPILTSYCNKTNRYRQAALQALGDIKDARAIQIFTELLSDSLVTVRREAAIALQKVSSQDAVLPLIAALDDPYQEVRYSAQKALEKITPIPKDILKKNYDSLTPRQKKHVDGIIGK